MKNLITTIITLIILLILNQCSQENNNIKLQYVGKEKCIQCHRDKWNTFKYTGMGSSFKIANKTNSSSKISDTTIIYDKNKKFYYKPFWDKDTLKVLEFRIYNNDTIHKIIFPVHYIVGSGQHTNSHLYNINGYLYQIPITFYTQKKIWDLAPGFEVNNTRFFRKIQIECISCHNALPKYEFSSQNKYYHIPEGIDCERCHGPGNLHIEFINKGDIKNAKKFIVNPKNLDKIKQMSICMRCHIQGIAVLKNKKKFTDFIPGNHINNYIITFTPDYGDSAFWMATHVERLMKSKCYQNSNLTCITCHNPHISVTKTTKSFFEKKCLSCHSLQNHYDKNCIDCHMPTVNSTDIPHIAITEHKIGIYKNSRRITNYKNFYLPERLKAITLTSPSDTDFAKAYLKYYEAYGAPPKTLEYAYEFIQKINIPEIKIHYYFLKQHWNKIIEEIPKLKNPSEWTYYRIAEAYINLNKPELAYKFLKKAIEKQRYNLDFNFKFAELCITLNKIPEAEKTLNFILKENPYYYKAYYLKGILAEINNKLKEAEEFYKKTLHFNPDYEKCIINYANLLIKQRRKQEAKRLLETFLHFNPNSSAYIRNLYKIL